MAIPFRQESPINCSGVSVRRRRFPGERTVAPGVHQRGRQHVFADVRVAERVQLFGQGTAADPARSPVHHRLHAQTTRGPGGDERLEVRGHGGGPFLSDHFHVFHVSRHYCRTVFGAPHNRRVTARAQFAVLSARRARPDDGSRFRRCR